MEKFILYQRISDVRFITPVFAPKLHNLPSSGGRCVHNPRVPCFSRVIRSFDKNMFYKGRKVVTILLFEE